MNIRTRIIEALRTNWMPGLLLQGFALALVLGYYHVPAVTTLCVRIGELKTEYGYLFSALSTGLCGGLLPFLILWSTGQVKRGMSMATGLVSVLFWMWKGAEIDLLYRIQSWFFGDGIGVKTILKKVVVDQFGYNLFYAVFCIAIFNLWKANGFSLHRSQVALDWTFFTEVIPTMMLSTWMIWLPTTAIAYSMPAPLQIPLFNIVLCFYVLLVTVIASSPERTTEGVAQ